MGEFMAVQESHKAGILTTLFQPLKQVKTRNKSKETTESNKIVAPHSREHCTVPQNMKNFKVKSRKIRKQNLMYIKWQILSQPKTITSEEGKVIDPVLQTELR